MVKLLPKRQQKIKPYINSPKLTGWKSWIPFGQTIVDSYVQDINDELAKHTIQDARKKLYDNMTPIGYNNSLSETKSRFIGALQGKPDKIRLRDIQRGEQIGEGGIDAFRDDIWATYLQIPENQRHKGKVAERNKLTISKYSPTKGSENTTYYDIPIGVLSKYIVKEAIGTYDITRTKKFRPVLKIGQNKVSDTLSAWLGNHTLGRGVDPQKGEYVSYYDKWDISGLGSNNGDNMGNIGKPVNIYGRVYLDDYYGVNSKPNKGEYYGGYLPEVIVKNKRK